AGRDVGGARAGSSPPGSDRGRAVRSDPARSGPVETDRNRSARRARARGPRRKLPSAPRWCPCFPELGANQVSPVGAVAFVEGGGMRSRQRVVNRSALRVQLVPGAAYGYGHAIPLQVEEQRRAARGKAHSRELATAARVSRD